MKYSLQVEGGSHGDPVDILLGDKTLLGLVISYVVIVFIIIYLNDINLAVSMIF